MFAHRYFASRSFAPRYFPDGGSGEPVVVVEEGGHSDEGRRKRKKPRFSVFEHIEKSLAEIDNRRLHAKDIIESRDMPILSEHFGIEIPKASQIEYRNVLSKFVKRQNVSLPSFNQLYEDEAEAIALILQMVI